jgi:hypothetical protein
VGSPGRARLVAVGAGRCPGRRQAAAARRRMGAGRGESAEPRAPCGRRGKVAESRKRWALPHRHPHPYRQGRFRSWRRDRRSPGARWRCAWALGAGSSGVLRSRRLRGNRRRRRARDAGIPLAALPGLVETSHGLLLGAEVNHHRAYGYTKANGGQSISVRRASGRAGMGLPGASDRCRRPLARRAESGSPRWNAAPGRGGGVWGWGRGSRNVPRPLRRGGQCRQAPFGQEGACMK